MMLRRLFGLELDTSEEETLSNDENKTEEVVVEPQDDPLVDNEAVVVDNTAITEAAEKAAAEEAQRKAEEETKQKAEAEAKKQAEEKAELERLAAEEQAAAEKAKGKEKAPDVVEEKKDEVKLEPQQAEIAYAPTRQSVVKQLRDSMTHTTESIQTFLTMYRNEFEQTARRAHKGSQHLANELSKAATDMMDKESLKAKEYADDVISGFVDKRLGKTKEKRYKFSPTLSLLNRAGLLPKKVEEHPKLESYFRLKK